MNTKPIQIRLELPECYRRQAAEMHHEAFHRELAPILGTSEGSLALLEQILDPGSTIVAVHQDQLVGIAVLERKAYTPAAVRGISRLHRQINLAYSRFRRRQDLLLESLVVLPSMRRAGIGTCLLQAVLDWANVNRIDRIWADVEATDSQPDAHYFFERLGFAAVNTRQYPHLYHSIGLWSVTTMIKNIKPVHHR
jgi:GNAT superfamily N-acetyltransferase